MVFYRIKSCNLVDICIGERFVGRGGGFLVFSCNLHNKNLATLVSSISELWRDSDY